MKMLKKDKVLFDQLTEDQKQEAIELIKHFRREYPITYKDFDLEKPDEYFNFYLPYGSLWVKYKEKTISSDPTNEDRSKSAELCLIAYDKEKNKGANNFDNDPQTVLSDVLTDLMHFANQNKLNFKDALNTAKLNFKITFIKQV